MTPERLQQIEELYHEAKSKDTVARALFLEESCVGDADLRREVESLLHQPDAIATIASAPEAASGFFFENLVGRELGKFRIVSLLRDGGMARVYKGYQESVDRFVAVKVLPRQYANDPRFVERFKQEAHIVAKLHHPHILSVFDYGESEGYTYLAMPFIETGTLADRLARGPLSSAETARIINQIAGALDYAHAQGIVHRDIKPSNILMDAEGNAFVADFGIATILGNARHLTQTGAFLASPGYCSPEQLKGGEVGPHSDLYSVGMILYEMLTGTAPFHLDGSLASILKRADSTLPAPRIRNSGITSEVEAVIVKSLSPSKSERYATGKDLSAALATAMRAGDEQETSAVVVGSDAEAPVEPVRPRRTPAWFIPTAVAVALVIVAAIAATMMMRPADAPKPPQETRDSAPTATVATAPPPAAPAPAAAEQPASNPPAKVAPPSATSATAAKSAAPASAPAPAARPAVVTAKQMYTTSSGGQGNPGLKYRIIQQRGSGETDADPATTFHTGDRVRFAFESNIDGYLYVIQAGSTGRWTVLFPNPEANGGLNAVRSSSEYLVPDNAWFAFDETPGTEEVFVVLSKQPLDTLPGFNAPVKRRESIDRSVVVGLQARLQSRDLVFEKDRSSAADGQLHQTTYIVNRGDLANQVAALIQLTHAK